MFTLVKGPITRAASHFLLPVASLAVLRTAECRHWVGEHNLLDVGFLGFPMLLLPIGSVQEAFEPLHSSPSALAALDYFVEEMDTYHSRTVIYDDLESGGERFVPSGLSSGENQEDWASLLSITHPREEAHSGATCMRIAWAGRTWMSLNFQYPENNWRGQRGLDIRGARTITLWTRCEKGANELEFMVGPAGGATNIYRLDVADEWRSHTLAIGDLDLGDVTSAIGFRSSAPFILYLDDIVIDHVRLHEPRLIRSYHLGEAEVEGIEQLRNASYVYDNALSICALLSSPVEEHRERARILGNAFVDLCAWEPDGRIRNAYSCGDLFGRFESTGYKPEPRLPGHMDRSLMRGTEFWKYQWLQDSYAKGSDAGNTAWVILALLNLWADGGREETTYLECSRRLGDWVLSECSTGPTGMGFRGGIRWDGPTGKGEPCEWQATEHNIDLAVAFRRLAEAEVDLDARMKWQQASQSAAEFVAWAGEQGRAHGGRLVAGTKEGTVEPELDFAPLDPQTWSVLAFPGERVFERGLNWALANCAVEAGGVSGLGFSTASANIWPEGTAQVALTLAAVGRKRESDAILDALDDIQLRAEMPEAAAGAQPAAYPDSVDTGYGPRYHPYGHTGATAWFVLAHHRWNPFTGKKLQAEEIDTADTIESLEDVFGAPMGGLRAQLLIASGKGAPGPTGWPGLPSMVVVDGKGRVIDDSGRAVSQGCFSTFLPSPHILGNSQGPLPPSALRVAEIASRFYSVQDPRSGSSLVSPEDLSRPAVFSVLREIQRHGGSIQRLAPIDDASEPAVTLRRLHLGESISESYLEEVLGTASVLPPELDEWASQLGGRPISRLCRVEPETGLEGPLIGFIVDMKGVLALGTVQDSAVLKEVVVVAEQKDMGR